MAGVGLVASDPKQRLRMDVILVVVVTVVELGLPMAVLEENRHTAGIWMATRRLTVPSHIQQRSEAKTILPPLILPVVQFASLHQARL